MRKPINLFIFQILVIPIVIFIFKMPAEKKVLSLFANGVFWVTGIVTLMYRGPFAKWSRIAGTQFLVLAVLPISILRFMSWESEFNQESLIGLRGSQWHSLSNIFFMVMIGITLGIVWQDYNARKKR